MNTELQELITSIFALALIALGLSYLLRPHLWARLYRDFEQHPGDFIPTGLLVFVTGLHVAIGVNDWSSTWPIFVTAFGWLMMLEAGIMMIKPSLVGSVLRRMGNRQVVYLRLGGVLLVGLGSLLAWEYLLQGWF